MNRQERRLHKNFVDYQNFIVNHKNYETLPNKFNSRGEITWVKVKDKERTLWWDTLKSKMELPDRASVAREIHPPELKGMKPCQVCGEYLNINYRYLNSNAFKQIQELVPEIKENRLKYSLEDLANITKKYGSAESITLLAKFLGKSDFVCCHHYKIIKIVVKYCCKLLLFFIFNYLLLYSSVYYSL